MPIAITESTIVARINRKLRPSMQSVRRTRGEVAELGTYYLVDHFRNAIEATHVDPLEMGRELGVVQPHERVADG